MSDESLSVRCFCTRQTLLAVCGRDTKDLTPFVHVKTTKNKKVITEVIITSGVVRIRCRECFRWHTIRIIKQNIQHQEENLPETISVG